MGDSPVVQWLGLHASTAEGLGVIPGWGTKIPQIKWQGHFGKAKITNAWRLLNKDFYNLTVFFINKYSIILTLD